VATVRGCYTIVGAILAAAALAAALGAAWWLHEPAGLDRLRSGSPPETWAALEQQRDAWRGTA
jgi:hypothetical protein